MNLNEISIREVPKCDSLGFECKKKVHGSHWKVPEGSAYHIWVLTGVTDMGLFYRETWQYLGKEKPEGE